MTQRHSALVAVLGVILLIKFGFLPLLEWQESYRQELILEKKRITKAQRVLNNAEQFEQQFSQLEQLHQAQQGLLFSSQPDNQFQLSRQQQIEALLSSYDLRAERINWLAAINVASGQVRQYSVTISVEGKITDILRWHLAVEKQKPLIDIVGFDVRMQRQTDSSLGRGAGEYQFRFYAEGEESDNAAA